MKPTREEFKNFVASKYIRVMHEEKYATLDEMYDYLTQNIESNVSMESISNEEIEVAMYNHKNNTTHGDPADSFLAGVLWMKDQIRNRMRGEK